MKINYKKQAKKFLCGMLSMVMVLALVQLTPVSAASTKVETTSKKVVLLNKKYGKIKAKCYYEKIYLKGDTDAINKINETLKQTYADMEKSKQSGKASLIEYAKGDANGDYAATYVDTTTAKVSYNAKGIICIQFSEEWFAGGVSNPNTWGITFNIKTGEQLSLDQVCNSTPKKIAATLRKKIKKDDSYASVENVTAAKVPEMNYYLTSGNKAVVCFGPYELGYGGWVRTYTIKSKYK
jgi:hypothetical protein